MSRVNLRYERLNRGMSIRVFAAEAGVSRAVVERIEAGESVSARTAKRVADYLGDGVKVTDLIPLDDIPPRGAA